MKATQALSDLLNGKECPARSFSPITRSGGHGRRPWAGVALQLELHEDVPIKLGEVVEELLVVFVNAIEVMAGRQEGAPIQGCARGTAS